jgi:glucose-1-phosphate adenylyltransferase
MMRPDRTEDEEQEMARTPRTPAPLARDAMAYVLAGGRGSRLMELTDRRAKPAVYFGGKSRIIDFALSNALNSGIRRIAVATQYKAHSLIRHLQRGWNFLRPERNESFDILPASQRVSETSGTRARPTRSTRTSTSSRATAALHGHPGGRPHLQDGLRADAAAARRLRRRRHRRLPRGAAHGGTGFGVMHVDETTASSPSSRSRRPARHPGKPGHGARLHGHLCLRDEVPVRPAAARRRRPGSSRDFGKDIIPYIVKNGKAVAHRFTPQVLRALRNEAEAYWRDVGTVDAYWEANIDLTDIVPELDLYDRDWPIWTYAEITPPAKFVHDLEGRRGRPSPRSSRAAASSRAPRCKRSLLFTGVRVNSYSCSRRRWCCPTCTSAAARG